MKSNTKKIYAAADLITFILELNLALVVGIIVGFVILGIGPSLQASHHMAKLRHQQKSLPFFKTFFSYYKEIFWQANQLILPLEIFYVAPMIVLLTQHGDSLSRGLSIVLLISIVIGTMTVLTLFPMVEFYKVKTSRYVISASRFITYNPIGCLIALGCLALCLYVVKLFPGVTLFIFGLAVYLNMGFYLRFFEQNEEKVQKSQKEASLETNSLKGVLEK
ncbi:MAG TPA: DUF624 domain-containing protein [Candidatus Tetragenococcus pullicola]|nr:DUF624 domain-containing protein [Candidatus Tetragenococcus pullicola]